MKKIPKFVFFKIGAVKDVSLGKPEVKFENQFDENQRI
jgi:hypothetical protein